MILVPIRFSLAFVLSLFIFCNGEILAFDEAPLTNSIRVVSYNIKHGEGNDRKVDLDRTGNVLKQLVPDIVGLQEVDRTVGRSGRVDQATQLGKQLEMQSAFGRFMDYQGGEYGMAILSKYPIVRQQSVPLPPGGEPRIALAVEVRLPSGESIMIVNVHFDWVESDRVRFAQATALKRFLDGLSLPYLLLGDFNDRPGSRTIELLSEGALPASKPPEDRYTFSSAKPEMEIDFIFGAPESAWEPLNVRVIDDPVTSDHRPVVAEMQLLEVASE